MVDKAWEEEGEGTEYDEEVKQWEEGGRRAVMLKEDG